MAYNTDNLGLFCYDADIDGSSQFSIEQALNDNWAKIDNLTATKTWVNDQGFLKSHQSLSNYVTLNTVQNILANKSFTGTVVFNGTTMVPASDTPGCAIRLVGQSKNQNGYVRFGNGICIQWGIYNNENAACNAGAERTNTITTPINISKKPWIVLTSSTSIRLIPSAHDYTTTGFTWKLYNPSSSSYTGLHFTWMAIYTE